MRFHGSGQRLEQWELQNHFEQRQRQRCSVLEKNLILLG
jgi:hypothetical protein